GRIVAVGEGGGHNMAAARYLADGTVDPSFGGGGLALPPAGSTTQGIAWAVARQDDGGLVLGGWRGVPGAPVLGRVADRKLTRQGRAACVWPGGDGHPAHPNRVALQSADQVRVRTRRSELSCRASFPPESASPQSYSAEGQSHRSRVASRSALARSTPC